MQRHATGDSLHVIEDSGKCRGRRGENGAHRRRRGM